MRCTLEIAEIKPALEALLLASDKPVPLPQIAKVLDGMERMAVHQTLEELAAEYTEQGRGFQLTEIAEGWQLATRPQYANVIRKMNRSKVANRLTRPALETLAIMAYRQPITKAEVEGIRGVNSDGVINSLLERRMIRTVGRKDVVGRPLLYGTTREFLQAFGLKDLVELPKLTELKDLLRQDPAGELWDMDEGGNLVEKMPEELLKQHSAGEEETSQALEAQPQAVAEPEPIAPSGEPDPE
jgi:segregation and condensation protein B